MKNIILADDDHDFRLALAAFVRRAGYCVHEADDGAKVLALREAYPDSIVILDILMPGTDGLESITTLLQKDPTTRILAVSGGGQIAGRSYLHMATRLGARVTLEKPFAVASLLQAVQALEQAGPPCDGLASCEGTSGEQRNSPNL